jgi:hypothetical protein
MKAKELKELGVEELKAKLGRNFLICASNIRPLSWKRLRPFPPPGRTSRGF